MQISNEDKQFLESPEIQKCLKEFDFTKIYSLYKFRKSQLTQIFVDCGINPLLYLTQIPNNAFQEISEIKGVYKIPNTITDMGFYAFYGCKNLTGVTLSTNLKTIPYNCFCSCSKLTTVNIPINILCLSPNCLANTKLTTINYEGTMSQWFYISRGQDWDAETPDYTVYCIDGIITKEYANK